jgi:hypothetical protein
MRPVEVALYLADGTYVIHDGQTQNASAHGALVTMKQEIPTEKLVAIRTRPDGSWAAARIARCEPRRETGMIPVGVELLYPREEFWGVLSWPGV